MMISVMYIHNNYTWKYMCIAHKLFKKVDKKVK